MKIDFVKTLEASAPYIPGTIYFESNTSLIKVATATNQYRVYGGVRDASYDASTESLTILTGNGDEIYLDFTQFAKQSDLEDDEYVISTAINQLNDQLSSMQEHLDYWDDNLNNLGSYIEESITTATSELFNDAVYDSSTKRINFYHDSSILKYIDATDFIKDGMVNDVSIHNGTGANASTSCLVISFNTDASTENIEIPLTNIFNPNNYYTKTQIDASFLPLAGGTMSPDASINMLTSNGYNRVNINPNSIDIGSPNNYISIGAGWVTVNDDYNGNTELRPEALYVLSASGRDNYIGTWYRDGSINRKISNNTSYNYLFPSKSGTFAMTSDIPTDASIGAMGYTKNALTGLTINGTDVSVNNGIATATIAEPQVEIISIPLAQDQGPDELDTTDLPTGTWNTIQAARAAGKFVILDVHNSAQHYTFTVQYCDNDSISIVCCDIADGLEIYYDITNDEITGKDVQNKAANTMAVFEFDASSAINLVPSVRNGTFEAAYDLYTHGYFVVLRFHITDSMYGEYTYDYPLIYDGTIDDDYLAFYDAYKNRQISLYTNNTISIHNYDIIQVNGIAITPQYPRGTINIPVPTDASIAAMGYVKTAPGTLNTDNSTGLDVSTNESLAGTINLHKIAKTGSYTDLLDKPDLSSYVLNSDYEDDQYVIAYALNELNTKLDSSYEFFSEYFLQGIYLNDSPVIVEDGYAYISYTQTKADWNATSGNAQILNKPDLSLYMTVADYEKDEEVIAAAFNDLNDRMRLFEDSSLNYINTINTIKVNGSALTPDSSKAVDITIPTDASIAESCKLKIIDLTDASINNAADYTFASGTYQTISSYISAGKIPVIQVKIDLTQNPSSHVYHLYYSCNFGDILWFTGFDEINTYFGLSINTNDEGYLDNLYFGRNDLPYSSGSGDAGKIMQIDSSGNWRLILLSSLIPNLWESGTATRSIQSTSTNCSATGIDSVAHGYNCLTGGNDASNNRTGGSYSDSDKGRYAHAEGNATIAQGACTHSEGIKTLAIGSGSHAEGYRTIAKNYYEHAEGSYNVSNQGIQSFGKSTNTIHSVGIGTADDARKNAFEIMQNGDAYLYGIGSYTGANYSSASTLQSVINGKLSGVSFNGVDASVTNGVAAITATIPPDKVFIIPVTKNGTSYTTTVTKDEAREALYAGKLLFVLYNNIVMPLRHYDTDDYGDYYFYAISNSYIYTMNLVAGSSDGPLSCYYSEKAIPSAVTESTVSGWGFTKNTGTLTGVNFNGVDASVTNGVASITATLPNAIRIINIDDCNVPHGGDLTIYDDIDEFAQNDKYVVMKNDFNGITHWLSLAKHYTSNDTSSYVFSSPLDSEGNYLWIDQDNHDSYIGGINQVELTSNKDTSISSASNNTMYPSSKAVYDFVKNGGTLNDDASLRIQNSDGSYITTISPSGVKVVNHEDAWGMDLDNGDGIIRVGDDNLNSYTYMGSGGIGKYSTSYSYFLSIPNKSGTIAVTSDIPTDASIAAMGYTKNAITSHADHKLLIGSASATAASSNTITYVESLTGTATATSGNLTVTPTLKTITIPTVNNATLTIQKNGTNVNTFTANSSSNVTANITVRELPAVTASDNGKILKVESGAWTAVTPITVYSGSGTPSNSTGNNGDIYIQQ